MSKKKTVAQPKENSPHLVLMMTGKNHIHMSAVSIWSMANSWHTLPELVICNDGTLEDSEIKKRLGFWPGKLSVQSWDSTTAYHLNKKRAALVDYGNAHPFGKKLASILRNAENGPVTWLDSDILFFKDFTPLLPQKTLQFACGGSEDAIAAYHEEVLKLFDTDRQALKKFNAGLLYVSGRDIYEKFGLEEILRFIHPNYDFCTEQTIFACIAGKSLGVIWNKDVIRNFRDDNQQLKPMPLSPPTVARHYTSNVRHLFWRDAFYLVNR